MSHTVHSHTVIQSVSHTETLLLSEGAMIGTYIFRKNVTEEFAHASFQPEDRLVGRRPEIEYTVVQSCVLVHLDI